MKQVLQYILTLLVALTAYINMCAQTVTNVEARQEGQTIVITFNMDKPCTPTIMYSTTGKNGNYNIIPEQFLQKITMHGTEYKYIWKVTEQFEDFSYENVVFKVSPVRIIKYPLSEKTLTSDKVRKLILSEEFTAIEIEITQDYGSMSIDRFTYLKANGFIYTLTGTENIDIAPKKTMFPKKGDVFTLFFQSIPNTTLSFDLIEPETTWAWFGILTRDEKTAVK